MKIFAFYLPQFHTIPENNKWWGEGFTEWVNVKKAMPLYKNHNQPRIPLNDNYYDLLDKKTLEWQADLVNKYKIGGLCFYHYWFAGNKLLEKPAEILLSNLSIELPFFFCWANESWTRSWDGNNKDVLMGQEYGNEQNWEQHFQYLLPFFKDKRYQKEDNKPIFLLYRSFSFEKCADWIKLWNQLAIQNGFDGMHFVSMETIFEKDNRDLDFNATLYFEPMNTIGHDLQDNSQISNYPGKIKRRLLSQANKIFKTNKIKLIYSYDSIWEKILNKKIGSYVYPGAFVGWDNTPRKGTKGLIVKGSSPEKFEYYFSELYQKAKIQNTPYIFINAWNEWAEGTYLEPDVVNKYGYLEAIKNVEEKYEKNIP